MSDLKLCRIDTLGIDENGSPVIIEYKRALNQKSSTRAFIKLNSLLDHRAEFELLVFKDLRQRSGGPDRLDDLRPG